MCQVCGPDCEYVFGVTSYCGDGTPDITYEQCDDGNTNNGDGCNQNCQIENGWYCSGATPCYTQCGDGTKAGTETCDDNNIETEICIYGETSCTVCNENCQEIDGETFYCGNGDIDLIYGEECDGSDGVLVHYTCTVECVLEYVPYCGDDNIDSIYGEECDDGEFNGIESYCNSDCSGDTTYCGDESVQEPNDFGFNEECDDGNDNNYDCCSNECENVESPFADKQEGVCQNSVKICDTDGNWAEPNYYKIPSYQETEIICDGLDNDCDGLDDTEEGFTKEYYIDLDGDGYGNISSNPLPICPTDSPIYVLNNLDCNDAINTIHPNANEVCGNNIDDDCSGTPDDNCPCSQGDIFCNNRPGVCKGYVLNCGSDGKIPICDWSSINGYEQTENSCDSLDNDCDGLIDEGCDDDRDGYADSSMNCDNYFIDSNGNSKSCSDYDNDCDDTLPKVYPGNSEICDGLDNDCDNSIDNVPEEELPYCHEIMSGYNNIGVCYNKKAICNYQRFKDWYCPLNEFYSNEICSDDLDNDCDGRIDEGCACESGEERICGSDLGECKQGIQKCVDSKWGNCDNSIEPTTETCDNLDNDCDGLIDDSVTKDCTSNEGCPGIQTCYEGQWLECQARCDNYIQIELNNDDFGKFVIDARLNRQDVKDSLETLKVINQTVVYSYTGDKTILKNTINPTNELKDFEYNLYIPKCLTPYLDQIEFENKDYTIIKEDPLIAWHFVNVNDRIDLNYEVKGEIDEACLEQIKGLPIAKVIGAELGKSNAAQVRNNLIKFIIGIWIIFFAVGSVIYVSKRNPGKAKKSEDDYKTDFIEKEKKILLKKIKDMKFKSKEQARHHMENLGISDEIKEWILKKL